MDDKVFLKKLIFLHSYERGFEIRHVVELEKYLKLFMNKYAYYFCGVWGSRGQ